MKILTYPILIAFGACLCNLPIANAECLKIAYNAKSKKTAVSTVSEKKGKCPKDTLALSKIVGPQGPAGSQGASGIDGKLAIFGNGSAGALNISSNTSWNSSPPSSGNYQFTDCSIQAGATLTVTSGTVIRCRGNVQIDGGLTVFGFRNGGSLDSAGSTSLVTAILFPASGIARRAPGSGEVGNTADALTGGFGGFGVPLAYLPFISSANLDGGGGGMGCLPSVGGTGGGAVSILASGSITIGTTGTISANGGAAGAGCGGGGGGVVLLGALTSISQNGTISVSGGAGGASATQSGAGGGGGGGIVKLVSPAISPSAGGTITLDGGAAGSNAIAVTMAGSALRGGGAGGGASGGDGGGGGAVDAAGVAAPAGAGTTGLLSVLQSDPSSVL